jgi:hypothetical protein
MEVFPAKPVTVSRVGKKVEGGQLKEGKDKISMSQPGGAGEAPPSLSFPACLLPSLPSSLLLLPRP